LALGLLRDLPLELMRLKGGHDHPHLVPNLGKTATLEWTAQPCRFWFRFQVAQIRPLKSGRLNSKVLFLAIQ
jgi:hypothetical protein